MPLEAEDADQLYKSAVEQFVEDNLSGAIDLFNKLIIPHPEFINSYYYLGSAYFQNNYFEAAAEYLTIAVQITPSKDAYIKLGLSLGQIKKINESIEVFEDATRKYSNSPDILSYLVIALRTTARLEEAVNIFLKAINLNKNHLGAN